MRSEERSYQPEITSIWEVKDQGWVELDVFGVEIACDLTWV